MKVSTFVLTEQTNYIKDIICICNGLKLCAEKF